MLLLLGEIVRTAIHQEAIPFCRIRLMGCLELLPNAILILQKELQFGRNLSVEN